MSLLTYFAIYTVVHVASFLFVKHYKFRDHYRVKDDKEFHKSHHPFMRTDLDRLSVIWSFPWYMTFWPRYLLSWTNMLICTVLMQVVMIGADKVADKMDGTRLFLMRILIQQACRGAIFFTGHLFLNKTEVNVDYRPYLGPDWVPTKKQGTIIISNHISWLDDLTALLIYFPRFVARGDVTRAFAIGNMANALDCIYVDR